MLNQYKNELQSNEQLFQRGIAATDVSLISSKNRPPVAGAISWARSIFYRIKRPVLKFITREDTFIEKKEGTEKQENKETKGPKDLGNLYN